MVSRRNNRTLILEQLVMDCTRFGFNEQESLNYIESRTGGKRIARSRYYHIKKTLSENELRNCKETMAHHMKAGFVINHFKRMDELEHLQTILFKTIHNETSKPVKEQSLFAISKIASNFAMNSRLLVELNISSPIIDQMKAEIDKALKSKSEIKSSQDKDIDLWNTPSACILTEEFIKNCHWQDARSLNSSTNLDSERVF